jgi:hypothetical protein
VTAVFHPERDAIALADLQRPPDRDRHCRLTFRGDGANFLDHGHGALLAIQCKD